MVPTSAYEQDVQGYVAMTTWIFYITLSVMNLPGWKHGHRFYEMTCFRLDNQNQKIVLQTNGNTFCTL